MHLLNLSSWEFWEGFFKSEVQIYTFICVNRCKQNKEDDRINFFITVWFNLEKPAVNNIFQESPWKGSLGNEKVDLMCLDSFTCLNDVGGVTVAT